MSLAYQIDTGYRPRPQQAELHSKLKRNRFGAAVCHRRLGKTVCAINHLIDAAIFSQKERPRFAYIAPTYRQGKAIAWDYLKHYTKGIPGVQVNESELRIDLPNTAQIRIYGADNPDSLRGLYFDGAVLDEYGLMPSRTFSEVVRPALADRKGWALFIGTPNGKNQFYEVCELAKKEEGWFFAEFKASDTKILDAEELEMARKSMTPDEFDQEFECSFEASVKGAVYADEIRKAREQKRIGVVPYDRTCLVETFWDIGYGDSTAIWFVQVVMNEIHLIDYYENSGQPIDHYAGIVRTRGYSYARHVGPHDLDKHEFGTGKTIKESAQKAGIYFEVCPQLGLEEGINAARQLFTRCYFDQEKCRDGLEALMNYRWDFNSRIDEYKPVPVHDWASHGADAFRYMAIMTNRARKPVTKINYPKVGVI